MAQEKYEEKFSDEFEEIWRKAKLADKRREEEWNALPEEEKERMRAFYDKGFVERITDSPFDVDDDKSDYNSLR